MTCVVGIVGTAGTGSGSGSGTVHMGADSASVGGQYLNVLTRRKIFRLGDRGDMLIGVSGSLRLAQLVRYRLQLPEHPDGKDVEAYLAIDFMDALRTCLKDGGHLDVSNTANEETDSSLLIGYRGRLFHLTSDFTLCENSLGYDAIGSGTEVAMGSLHTTGAERDTLHPQERLFLALEAAAEFNTCVRGPFVFERLENAEAPVAGNIVPAGLLSSVTCESCTGTVVRSTRW